MGQFDLHHSEYFDSNIRFADAYNGILFDGKQVIKPEDLEECDSVFVQIRKRIFRNLNQKTNIYLNYCFIVTIRKK